MSSSSSSGIGDNLAPAYSSEGNDRGFGASESNMNRKTRKAVPSALLQSPYDLINYIKRLVVDYMGLPHWNLEVKVVAVNALVIKCDLCIEGKNSGDIFPHSIHDRGVIVAPVLKFAWELVKVLRSDLNVSGNYDVRSNFDLIGEIVDQDQKQSEADGGEIEAGEIEGTEELVDKVSAEYLVVDVGVDAGGRLDAWDDCDDELAQLDTEPRCSALAFDSASASVTQIDCQLISTTREEANANSERPDDANKLNMTYRKLVLAPRTLPPPLPVFIPPPKKQVAPVLPVAKEGNVNSTRNQQKKTKVHTADARRKDFSNSEVSISSTFHNFKALLALDESESDSDSEAGSSDHDSDNTHSGNDSDMNSESNIDYSDGGDDHNRNDLIQMARAQKVPCSQPDSNAGATINSYFGEEWEVCTIDLPSIITSASAKNSIVSIDTTQLCSPTPHSVSPGDLASGWICEACTYVNENDLPDMCSMCETKRTGSGWSVVA